MDETTIEITEEELRSLGVIKEENSDTSTAKEEEK